MSALSFGSLSICCPTCFAALRWSWADSTALYTSEFMLLLLSAVASSLNTSDPVPLATIHAHVIHSASSTMFGRWCGMLQTMNCFSSSQYFSISIILVQVNLGFICSKRVFKALCRLFYMFFWPPCSWVESMVCTLLKTLCYFHS